MRRDAANPLVSAAHDDHWYSTPSPWQRACRLMYDRAALALIGRGRGSGVRQLGRIADILHACGLQAPSPSDVTALFPSLSGDTAARVARQIAVLRFKNRAAVASFHAYGLDQLARLVCDECAASPPPVIVQRTGGLVLLTFHIGAEFGVAAAATRWGIPVSPMRVLPADDANVRARRLKQAIDTVRSGGMISAAADGPGGASCAPVTCLGRHIILRRGALVIARLTGVPVVPMIARWTATGQITTCADEPLTPGRHGGADGEQALAAAAARWLERRLLEHPADIWPYTLRNLLGAPRSSSEVRRAHEGGIDHQRL